MDFLSNGESDSPLPPGPLKRKRSTPSHDFLASAPSLSAHAQGQQHSHPSSKLMKPNSPAPNPNYHHHLAINYLARQCRDDLPLVSSEDGLNAIVKLVADYHGVLDRHESLACNMGARQLGPILMKRFERLFDAPPRILVDHSHGRESHITWLDIVEFARTTPDQFVLERRDDGQQTSQFWLGSRRVEVQEDDYVLIASGMPQKMIPPQPIVEDEEQELGTLEILEKNLSGIIHLADQVAAKTRQLNHRLKARKQAILDRRSSDTDVSYVAASNANLSSLNGGISSAAQSPLGFVAVNSRQHTDSHTELSRTGASAATHSNLRSRFLALNEKPHRGLGLASLGTSEESKRMSMSANGMQSSSQQSNIVGLSSHSNQSALDFPMSDSFAPTPQAAHAAALSALGIPSSAAAFPPMSHQPQQQAAFLPQSGPQPTATATAPAPSTFTPPVSQTSSTPAKEDGPYKAQMVQRMEQLKKGDRINPPCDRCRRLHMDCLKNLTACVGCTKKHAKCSWRDVREGELNANTSTLNGMKMPSPTHMDVVTGVANMEPKKGGDRRGTQRSAISTPSADLVSQHIYPTLGLNGTTTQSSPYPTLTQSPYGVPPTDPDLTLATAGTTSSSPLDPIAAASLAAAAQAVSSHQGRAVSESMLVEGYGSDERRDGGRKGMGTGGAGGGGDPQGQKANGMDVGAVMT